MGELTTYQRSFADLLSGYKFETFATYTTKRTLSLAGARRLASKFGDAFDAGERTSLFWAAEPFDTRVGYHFHGLINSYGKFQNNDYWNWWSMQMNLGRSQFLPINRAMGYQNQVEKYITKYITKRLADFDLYTAKLALGGSTGKPEIPDYVTKYHASEF